MKIVLFFFAMPFLLWAGPQSQSDSIKTTLEKLETTQQTQSTQIDLLEKKIDLAKEANENRLNAMQVSIDKQLFYLDPLILAGVGLSAIGGLIYLYFSFVPKRVREETARKIAALTDTDQATVAEIIEQREVAKKMKQSVRISILCADDGQKSNAETLLKNILGFQKVTSDATAEFDLLIFYDPAGDETQWEKFRNRLNPNDMNHYFLYFGKPKRNFDGIHENLNYANSKFTLESLIVKTLQFHPKFNKA